MSNVLKWAYVHYALEVEEFDTLNTAIEARLLAAVSMRRTKSGNIRTPKSFSEADSAGWTPKEPAPTTRVDVALSESPDAKWAMVAWCHSDEEAATKATSWKALVGDDRVRITPLGPSR